MEALKAAREGAPDLLISDVVMPGLSGVDLAIQVKQGFPALKVLLFSGQAPTVALLKTARELGYEFEILEKPIHPIEFLQRVKAATGQGPL